jgi:hypothetical protein
MFFSPYNNIIKWTIAFLNPRETPYACGIVGFVIIVSILIQWFVAATGNIIWITLLFIIVVLFCMLLCCLLLFFNMYATYCRMNCGMFLMFFRMA